MAQEPLVTASSLIVIGGSAGSLDVLIQLLPYWDLPAKVAAVIVLHRKADGESQLTDLLNARSKCPVTEAMDKQPIFTGNIYLAPADYHLFVEEDHSFSLDYSEKINYSRPSIDATFETAALAYREQLICLLLSGANTDGTNGLIAAQQLGAKVLVQRPDTALASFMPQHALNELKPNAILNPEDMLATIDRLIAAQRQD